MNFTVLTLFADVIASYMNSSIMGRALQKGIINLDIIDIRDYSCNKHNRVDDYPYGGGAGMVMEAGPVYKACEAAKALHPDMASRIIYMSPSGRRFDQEIAKELAKEEDLILLCGHYEGIDERVLQLEIAEDDYISMGDFVLTGGELPALAVMDAVSRLIPGVLNNDESAGDESFENGLLEYPQYTRPEEFMGIKVPEILLSGHHANIAQWRLEQSIRRTLLRRPDLLESSIYGNDRAFMKAVRANLENGGLDDEQSGILKNLLKPEKPKQIRKTIPLNGELYEERQTEGGSDNLTTRNKR